MKGKFTSICFIFLLSFLLVSCTNCGSKEREDVNAIPQVINRTKATQESEGMKSQKTDQTETGFAEESDQHTGNHEISTGETEMALDDESVDHIFSVDAIPEYSGAPFYELNNGIPLFSDDEKKPVSYESYSELDDFGRCGTAYAVLGKELMPTEERGTIGPIKPSGWHTVKYNDLIDGNYLYNRCHLIGYQLAGENANVLNLFTGTRYLNMQGMLPFENMVSGYITETSNHVLYRVTPIFENENLVASGITIEAYSIEDSGTGICFYVYIYNVQPGIVIDYTSGESTRDPSYVNENNDIEVVVEKSLPQTEEYPENAYVVNINTHKFHYPTCDSVADMSEKNKKISTDSREKLIEQGYSPCKRCNP